MSVIFRVEAKSVINNLGLETLGNDKKWNNKALINHLDYLNPNECMATIRLSSSAFRIADQTNPIEARNKGSCAYDIV